MKYVVSYLLGSANQQQFAKQGFTLVIQTNPGDKPGDVKAVSGFCCPEGLPPLIDAIPSSIGRVALKRWFMVLQRLLNVRSQHLVGSYLPSHPCLCPKAIGSLNL